MAGIGKVSLADTALDRAFAVEMSRKSISIKKVKYRNESCDARCAPIRDLLYLWALQHAPQISREYESADLEAAIDRLALNDRAADIWTPIFAIARTLQLDPATIRGLSALAIEMGGDPDAIDDARKLAVVRGLRTLVDTRGEVIAITGELVEKLASQDMHVEPFDLARLFKAWGFEKRSTRLPGVSTPRYAWELLDTRLAELEQELSGDAHNLDAEDPPSENPTTSTTASDPTTTSESTTATTPTTGTTRASSAPRHTIRRGMRPKTQRWGS
jgi:hypothetical protein